jgi:YegS/Rv2252/BmrU family lipid kinase
VNPTAGKGRWHLLEEGLLTHLRARGFSVDILRTKQAGDAGRFASQLSADIDRVLVGGGDGTLNEVINGLQNTNVTIGIIPLGTANVVAKEFELPYTPEKLFQTLAGEFRRTIDLLTMRERKFVLVAGLGFDAQVTRSMKETRRGNIAMASYALPIMRTWQHLSLPEIFVWIDGREMARPARSVIISNLRNYGGPMIITPNAKCDDGLLDACLLYPENREGLLWFGVGALTGGLDGWGRSRIYQSRNITLCSPTSVAVQIDGDYYGEISAGERIEFNVLPISLTLLVPPRELRETRL